MAKSGGMGMKALGVFGGVMLMLVAWRFPMPLYIANPTTLLSVVAVLLGMIAGWREAVLITSFYVIGVVLGLPPAIWKSHAASEPFLSVPTNGLTVGLVAAAFVAAKLAPAGAHSGYPKLALAVILGHLAYLAIGIAWLTRFAPLAQAAPAILKSQIIPVLAKCAVTFLVAMGAGKVIKN